MNEHHSNALPSSREHSRNRRIDWVQLKELSTGFIERSKRTALVLLAMVVTVAPQLIANSEEFDNTLCSIKSVIEQDAHTTSITCTTEDGREIALNLEFLIYSYDVSVYPEDHLHNPPFLSSEFISDINNPNFNCHSYTLQKIQETTGVDFGASTDRWLQTGLDSFLQEFGTEVARMDSIPTAMTEDVIDISSVQSGDVVLFFDHQGLLIHSATVAGIQTTEDGISYLQILNKLGEAGELSSSIDDMVRLYDLWGGYDELSQSGGGKIIVFRPNVEQLREAFLNTSP